MIKRILEIGVAVDDIESAGGPFVELLGASKGGIFQINRFNMNMQMLRVGNVEIELMESLQKGGLIDRFIRKSGQGLHHIAFEVDDIVDAMQWCKQHDVEIIEDKVHQVYDIKAIFLHPSLFGGVLFELIQGNPKWVADSYLPDTLQDEEETKGIGSEGIVEIGILVNNLEATLSPYHDVFLTEKPNIIDFAHLSLRSSRLKLGNIALHIIEATSRKHYLGDLIERNATGLHHITLKVKNLASAMRYLKQRAIPIIEDTRVSLWNDQPAFIHPKALSGIPVRLSENMPVCLS